MGNISFTQEGFEDYLFWQAQDRRTLKRVNALIKDIERHPTDGIGKPEQLSGNLSGYWSRRIDEKNRMIYRLLADDGVEIHNCRSHYRET
ncbi:hypothetical protein FACS1894139_01420 [Planctomycetales bacterium]|nr:hypothetical protein FACS1894139_01420 [Planctomycetales bacterium]GHV23955.1 hypothetical protein AGMMS49959_18930 [Planctomycetales bacterium]